MFKLVQGKYYLKSVLGWSKANIASCHTNTVRSFDTIVDVY